MRMSRWFVGSSNNKKSGEETNAAASRSLVFCPPEREAACIPHIDSGNASLAADAKKEIKRILNQDYDLYKELKK